MTNTQIEANIKGLGNIFCCTNTDFHEALGSFSNSDLITARDLAYARITNPGTAGGWKNESISTEGSYVKEGSLLVPNSGHKMIWLRESLILKNPKDATISHKEEKEYSIDLNVDEFLEQIGKNNYLILKDSCWIPTNRLGEDYRTVWLFGDQAKDYGQYLRDSGIMSQEIFMGDEFSIDKRSGPFANQLLINRIAYPYIAGFARNLSDKNAVRWLIPEGNFLENILDYSRSFIPKDSWKDFENGLKEKYGGKNEQGSNKY